MGDTAAMPKLPARALSRLAPLALLVLLAPAPALAADPPAVTAGDGSATTLLVILLLGSLTAGLFFASPLRRRLARGSFASTRVPAAMSGRLARSPAAVRLDQVASSVHHRLAQLTAQWPALRTATPLPPMLGGDIFDEATAPSTGAEPRPNARSSAASAATPWSTAPVAADERYLPRR